jgi:hypothetical protein
MLSASCVTPSQLPTLCRPRRPGETIAATEETASRVQQLMVAAAEFGELMVRGGTPGVPILFRVYLAGNVSRTDLQ